MIFVLTGIRKLGMNLLQFVNRQVYGNFAKLLTINNMTCTTSKLDKILLDNYFTAIFTNTRKPLVFLSEKFVFVLSGYLERLISSICDYVLYALYINWRDCTNFCR